MEAGIIHLEGVFAGSGGVQLFCQSWTPRAGARAALVMVHGIGEHSGRYQHLVQAMLSRGFALHAFDLRGHGRSPGRRGVLNAWSEFRNDLRSFLGDVRRKQPRLRQFLFGHSMGGLIALEYALHGPQVLQGVIASAPPLGELSLPWHLQLGCRLLERLWPALALRSPLDIGAISRDPEVVHAYQGDPLTHALGTPRLGMELLRAARWTQSHAAQLRLPLLLLHGAADRITSPQESRRFAERVPVSLSELHEYPGGFHELHNDLLREEVFDDMGDWLERRIDSV